MKPAKQTTQNIDYYQYVEDVLTAEDVHDTHVVTEATASTGLFIILALVRQLNSPNTLLEVWKALLE